MHLQQKTRKYGIHPRKAPFVVDPSVREGEQGEDVAKEANGEDDGQVEGEGHLVLPGGLGHTVLLLPGGVRQGVGGRALECVLAIIFRQCNPINSIKTTSWKGQMKDNLGICCTQSLYTYLIGPL